jgi:hypothetical protein
LQPFDLIGAQAKNLADDLGLLGVKGHLAQAPGGDPLFGQTDFLGDIAPLDAFGHFGGDDFFGDF